MFMLTWFDGNSLWTHGVATCGETQTMSHIVNDCITTCFPGGLTALYLAADEAAVQWLGAFCKS